MKPVWEKLVDDESTDTIIRFRIVKGKQLNKDEVARKDTLFRLDRLKKKGWEGEYDPIADSTEKLQAELERVQAWRADMRA